MTQNTNFRVPDYCWLRTDYESAPIFCALFPKRTCLPSFACLIPAWSDLLASSPHQVDIWLPWSMPFHYLILSQTCFFSLQRGLQVSCLSCGLGMIMIASWRCLDWFPCDWMPHAQPESSFAPLNSALPHNHDPNSSHASIFPVGIAPAAETADAAAACQVKSAACPCSAGILIWGLWKVKRKYGDIGSVQIGSHKNNPGTQREKEVTTRITDFEKKTAPFARTKGCTRWT